MTRQRQIIVTVTYNDLGCIIDTKTEPYEKLNLQPTCNQLATDCISRQAAVDAMTNTLWHYPNECYRNLNEYEFAKGLAELGLKSVPSAQPETAKRIVGKSRDGMTMWYQCDMCNEPVDEKDTFCSGCGRRFVNG